MRVGAVCSCVVRVLD